MSRLVFLPHQPVDPGIDTAVLDKVAGELRALRIDGGYSCLYADPSWQTVTYSKKGLGRAPERHYDTISLPTLKAFPVKELAGKNCHLMLWATQPHLEQALDLMKAWGFRYSSIFKTWVKLNPRDGGLFYDAHSFHFGLGKTTRKNTEILLLGRKGSPKRLRNDIPELLISRRRRHSEKPDEVYSDIEAYAPGPYLEMFARKVRPGWASWGNEVGKLGEAKS